MCMFSNIWSEQNAVNAKWISAIVKQRLLVTRQNGKYKRFLITILVMKIALIYCRINLERFL